MRKACFLFVIVLLQIFQSSLCVHAKELESLGFIRCKKHELEALLKFKQSFTEDPLNRLSSWVGDDCCQWLGVTCDNVTYNVVKLNLRSQSQYVCLPDSTVSLQSSGVSSALLELKLLTHLDLSGNNFSGSRIPEFIGSFKHLRYLNLSNAGFSSPLPPQLGNLANLVHLDLNIANSCSDIALDSDGVGWASGLLKLQSLDMSGYNLSLAHDTLKVLNTLPALSALSLSECELDNSHLSEALLGNTSNSFFPTLQHLDLHLNGFEGPLPSVLKDMVSLRSLYLGDNVFNGSVPLWLRAMRRLEALDLSNNGFNYVEGGITSDSFLPTLQHLDLQLNAFEGPLPSVLKDMVSLRSLSLSGNHFNGSVPLWLRAMRRLEALDLSSNGFNYVEGGIIMGIMGNPCNFKYLDLSFNSISQEDIIEPSMSLSRCGAFELEYLALGSLPQHIAFDGHYPRCNLMRLDLHNNLLTGTIPKWLGNLGLGEYEIEVIDLSSNLLSGAIFEGNNASSLFYIPNSLMVLDLGDNMLSGEIQFGKEAPYWGVNLEILNLRGNHFNGPIPSQICELHFLLVLELAHNRLTGHIPPCLGSIPFSLNVEEGSISDTSLQIKEIVKGIVALSTGTKGGQSIIDLSSNNLVGTIPEELTNISALFALNLSFNHLTGHIPENIGNFKTVESLDLSNNHLSGTIPQSLASISWISNLNLSNNNLHGPIPTGRQLQTLDDPSIYAGNSGLCGFPLPNNCTKPDPPPSLTNVNPGAGKDEVEKEDKYEKLWFILAVMSGVATGFWGVVITLVIKRSWRESYFRYVEDVADRIYVPIKVRVNRFKRRFDENS
ncbi:hypothetical protein RND81_14G021500 [Saponaria officinalis]|uniref:Leucine-rich repeat-containing N-terminal plant-type domain-containing protein n=1 Tax=Saponaria officinalis TaxID=3572 RepID=A0AAW1GMG1_SAPOF